MMGELRGLVERTVAKALFMAAMTPPGVERDIAAACATDLLGHLQPGEVLFDEMVERGARHRWMTVHELVELGLRPLPWEDLGPEDRRPWIEREREHLLAALGEEGS